MKRKARKPKPWRISAGQWGTKVVAEERVIGGTVSLVWRTDTGARRRESLGMTVRDVHGELIQERMQLVNSRALKRAADLVEGKLIPGKPYLGPILARFRASEKVRKMGEYHQAETLDHLEFWRNVLGNDYPLSDLTGEKWTEVERRRMAGELDRHGLVVPPEKRQQCGPRPIRHAQKTLRQVCKWAIGERKLDRDWTQGLLLTEYLPKDKRQPVATPERAQRMLDAALTLVPETADYLPDLFTLAWECGHRISALLKLRWSDWSGDMLHWRGTQDKVKHDHVAPLTETAQTALRQLRARQATIDPEGWVFPHPTELGQPVDRDTATRWYYKVEKAAGLPHQPGGAWHSFRRGFATERKGVPITDVAAAGGWTNTATLLASYQKAKPDDTRRAVEAGPSLKLA